MALEQAYFISQITAAIFLIGSILFLAAQVRQNSTILQRMMLEDHRLGQNTLFEDIYRTREFAEFHMKINEYDSLDDVDKYRANYLAQKNIRSVLAAVQSRLDGYVSDDEWIDVKTRIKRIGRSRRRNLQIVWEQIKDNYPKRVQDIWEEYTREG
jgi:hypothetical protein